MNQITTVEQVKEFARQCTKEGLNFHPDDSFTDYKDESGEPLLTPEKSAEYDTLMNQCFSVCEAAGLDVYGVMLEVVLIETGMDKFIPLPSQSIAE